MEITEKSEGPASTASPGHAPGPQEKIEEGSEAYRPGGFHPVYIGDIYNERYKILNKIGYGAYSTVWLVKVVGKEETNQFFALKILGADCYGTIHHIFEREILQRLKNGDTGQLGYEQICHLVDDFEHEGPNGTHVCLIFELIGENLRSFSAWFPESRLPNQVMRRFTIQLLLALDYAHDNNVVHTDIQPNNIFVKFRDPTLIRSGYLAKVPNPKQDKAEKQYSVVPSMPLRHYYFTQSDYFSQFDIVLGDWGISSWVDKHLTEKIQPVALRAPEVLIGAPWDASTDFWNLGAVLLELFCAVRMFSGRVPPDEHYDLKQHLREIVDLFGPFPRPLLQKGNQDIVQSIFGDEEIPGDTSPLDRPGFMSEAFTPGLDEEVREQFVSFIFAIMKVNPADRLSPEDLLRQPWLDALR